MSYRDIEAESLTTKQIGVRLQRILARRGPQLRVFCRLGKQGKLTRLLLDTCSTDTFISARAAIPDEHEDTIHVNTLAGKTKNAATSGTSIVKLTNFPVFQTNGYIVENDILRGADILLGTRQMSLHGLVDLLPDLLKTSLWLYDHANDDGSPKTTSSPQAPGPYESFRHKPTGTVQTLPMIPNKLKTSVVPDSISTSSSQGARVPRTSKVTTDSAEKQEQQGFEELDKALALISHGQESPEAEADPNHAGRLRYDSQGPADNNAQETSRKHKKRKLKSWKGPKQRITNDMSYEWTDGGNSVIHAYIGDNEDTVEDHWISLEELNYFLATSDEFAHIRWIDGELHFWAGHIMDPATGDRNDSYLTSSDHAVYLEEAVSQMATSEFTGAVPGDTSDLLHQALIRENSNDSHADLTDADEASALLSENDVRIYLDRIDKEPAKPDEFDINDLNIVTDNRHGVDPKWIKYVQDGVNKYKDVFAGKKSDLVKPMTRSVKEHTRYQWKEDAKPVRVPRPKWGPHKTRFLTAWAKDTLRRGLTERCKPGCRYANRMVLARKNIPGQPKNSMIFKIRPCVDMSPQNRNIEKLTANYPDGQQQIRNLTGGKYYWYSDGKDQFNSIILHKDDRSATAVHTPIGLIQHKRLLFGEKNSPVIAQQLYRESIQTLPTEMQDRISNFQDDLAERCDTDEQCAKHFVRFLQMCREEGITLVPKKTCVFAESVTFYGFKISETGTEYQDKNVDPIRRLRVPENLRDLRRTLGLFVQLKDYVPKYRIRARPLSSMTSEKHWEKGKNPMGEEQIRAFHDLKTEMTRGVHLHTHDRTKPLCLGFDASREGAGAYLYQLSDDLDDKGEKKHLVIAYWSLPFNSTEQRLPAYYREGLAFVKSVQWSKLYTDYSSFPLRVITDHKPLVALQWVKHTSGRGKLSDFLFQMLHGVDYHIEHLAGTKNIVPDILSRYPVVAAEHLNDQGANSIFHHLLRALPESARTADKMWIWAEQNTAAVVRRVQRWRSPRNPIDTWSATSKDAMNRNRWDVALLAPCGEKATSVVEMAWRKISSTGGIAAVLVPTDLLQYIGADDDAKNPALQLAVRQAPKIAISSQLLTWIIFGDQVSGVPEMHSQVFSSVSETVAPAIRPDLFSAIPPLERWPALQKKAIKEYSARQQTKILRRTDGLSYYKPAGGTTAKLIVPSNIRIALTIAVHGDMHHMSGGKVLKRLQQFYHWTGMTADVPKWCSDCRICALSKLRRQLHHGHFSQREGGSPGKCYSFDWYALTASAAAHTGILGVMDDFTGELWLFALQDRKAHTIARAIHDGIFMTRGIPENLRSDDAKEFVGTVAKALYSTYGITHVSTHGHHPTGSALIERAWVFVGQCVRMLKDAAYPFWPRFVKSFQFAHNTTFKNSIGCTPFEAGHGHAARTLDANHVQPLVTISGGNDLQIEMSPRDYSVIRRSQQAFQKLAATHRDFYQKSQLERLNAKGHKAKLHKVGDRVAIYFPPSADTVAKRGRKAKHCDQYRGPCEITALIGKKAYAVRHIATGRTYKRSLLNVLPYKARSQEPAPPPKPKATAELVSDSSEHAASTVLTDAEDNFKTGEFIAYIDDESDNYWWIGRITKIENELLSLHIYATGRTDVKTAVYKPVFTDTKRGNKFQMGIPLERERRHHNPYTDEIEISEQKSQILARHLTFKDGKLDEAIFNSLKPRLHQTLPIRKVRKGQQKRKR